jgi:hypothetical protein
MAGKQRNTRLTADRLSVGLLLHLVAHPFMPFYGRQLVECRI